MEIGNVEIFPRRITTTLYVCADHSGHMAKWLDREMSSALLCAGAWAAVATGVHGELWVWPTVV